MKTKTCKTVLIVESVEKAVKFYTEKLAFDIVKLEANKEDGNQTLAYAVLKKFKCFIMLRTPKVEELAEFSFIKRCSNRGTGIFIIMKKGLDKYFARCTKKGVHILSEPARTDCGYTVFNVKDPNGIKLTFAEPVEGFKCSYTNFAGLPIDKSKSEDDNLEHMIRHLKKFGILRRFAKKFSKKWLKAAKK